MNSHITSDFRRGWATLPDSVQRKARKAYRLFQRDPRHPSLRFKKVHPTEPIFSARIDPNYRTVGVLQGDAILWFFIGNHEAYEALLKAL